MGCRGAPSWLCGFIPPPLICVAGPLGVLDVWFGVGPSASSQRRGLQDAPEGSSGICRPAQSRLSQLPFCGAESDRWLEASHRLVHSEWLCHPDQVPDGDSSVGFGLIQKGDWMFSIDLKDAYSTSRSPCIWTLGRVSSL